MTPEIVNRDAFDAMGLLAHIAPESENEETYGSIWRELETRNEELKPHSTDRRYYGLSFSTDGQGTVEYMAAMAVRPGSPLLEGLVRRRIPAARYAVFECPLQAIGPTYQSIFSQWLPQTEHVLDDSKPVFEQYPEQGSEDQPVRIHVPIRQEA